MIDWAHIDAERVLWIYVRERARLSSLPSSQGYDQDGRMPVTGPGPEWVSVLSLVRGIPSIAVAVLELRVLGAAGVALATDAGGLYDEQQAVGLTTGQIGRRLGLPAGEVRRLIRDAQWRVAENLAELRARGRP
mgnify:FL=1